MSEILNRLKQAEAERERVLAERRRLEAAVEASPTERPVAQAPSLQPASETPEQRSRFAAALGIAVAMAIVFWVGTLMPRKAAPPAQPTVLEPAPVAAAPEGKAPPPELFRMDADVDAFAARLKGKP